MNNYTHEIDGESAIIYKNGEYFDEVDVNGLIANFIEEKIESGEWKEV